MHNVWFDLLQPWLPHATWEERTQKMRTSHVAWGKREALLMWAHIPCENFLCETTIKVKISKSVKAVSCLISDDQSKQKPDISMSHCFMQYPLVSMFQHYMWHIDIRGHHIKWCSFILMKKLCFFDHRNMQDQLYVYWLQVVQTRRKPQLRQSNWHHRQLRLLPPHHTPSGQGWESSAISLLLLLVSTKAYGTRQP